MMSAAHRLQVPSLRGGLCRPHQTAIRGLRFVKGWFEAQVVLGEISSLLRLCGGTIPQIDLSLLVNHREVL